MSLFWKKYKNPDCTWLINSIVKKSTIRNAGKGRFTLDKIKKDSVIRRLKLIDLDDYIKMEKENNEKYTTEAYTVIFKNTTDLDNLVYYFNSSKQDSEEDIKLKITWFSFGLNETLYLDSFSNFYNHSDNNNLYPSFNNKGYLEWIALRDIKENSELFIDYNKWVFPDFFIDWCKKNKLSTVIDNI